MRRAALYSLLIHLAFFLLVFFGIPWLPKAPSIMMEPIPIEVLTIATETMSLNPVIKPVKEALKLELKLPEVKLEPEVKPTSPEPELEPKVEPILVPEPEPKPEEKKSEPKPEPKLEPKPKPAPPKPKALVKKLEKKKKENPKDDSFDSLLKNLEKDFKEKVEDDPEAEKDAKSILEAKQTGQVGEELTASETSLINSHFSDCWQMQGGAKNAEDINVKVQIFSNPDGTVRDAKILDTDKYVNDPYFRGPADSALRAAKSPRCANLPLSLERYEIWKDMKLNFNPKKMLGG